MPTNDRKPVSTDPRDIRLRNEHKKTHKILLEVQFDGKTIHDQQKTLKPDSTAIVEDLAGKVGEYTIIASSDGEQEVSDSWSVTNNSTAALVEISEGGELKLILDPQM